MKALLLKIVDMFGLYPLFGAYTRNSATIFMLHAIEAKPSAGSFDLNTDLLDRFLSYLKRKNYKVLSLEQYVDAIIEHRPTHKTVVFTVDDGYRDFYLHAYPVFKKFGYGATIFVTSDFVDGQLFFWWDQIEFCINSTRETSLVMDEIQTAPIELGNSDQKNETIGLITRYCKTLANDMKLTLLKRLVDKLKVDISGQPSGRIEPLKWSEISEMSQNGIDFHPHTKTHPIMSKVSREQKRLEITHPKSRLEAELGCRADIFCYPNGQYEDFDEEVIEELKRAGYLAAVTGIEGFDNTMAETDMFRLLRYPIPQDELRFKQYVCGLERFKRRFL